MKKEQEFEKNNLVFDEENLRICGVQFDSEEEFRSFANAIAINMYEGFEPTNESVQRIKDGNV